MIMTNIKITRRLARGQYEEGTEPEVYDIYFDVGLFNPLLKKWKIDKSALTREEAIKYALDIASKDSVVLILGKGRDNYMAIAFSEKEAKQQVIDAYFKEKEHTEKELEENGVYITVTSFLNGKTVAIY